MRTETVALESHSGCNLANLLPRPKSSNRNYNKSGKQCANSLGGRRTRLGRFSRMAITSECLIVCNPGLSFKSITN